MAFLDGSVVSVALPVIQAKLGASASQAQWVVEAYALFLTSLVLAGGSLADRFGRRRIFEIGAALFAATSAACGLAAGPAALIAARGAQGIAAALLVPSSLALLGAGFPAAERGRAVGSWSALTSIAAAGGPILGGWLVQTVSWRAAFFLNLPVAVAVFAISRTKIPESRGLEARGLDVTGSLLATAGLGGVVLGLIEAGDRGWSDAFVRASLAAGASAFAGFLAFERRAKDPMVPLDLFRSRAFVAANLLTLFLYAALGVAFYYLPFDLIQTRGYSPSTAGAALLPLVGIVLALSRFAGSLSDRIGARLPLTAGPALSAAGFAFLALSGAGGYAATILPGIVAIGLGLSLAVTPLTAAVLGSVDASETGAASGLNNAVARVAGLLAIAVLGVVVSARYNRALDRNLAGAGFKAAGRVVAGMERRKLAAARPSAALPNRERAQAQDAIVRSFEEAYRFAMGLAAGLAFLAAAAGAAGFPADHGLLPDNTLFQD
jgi:EmrB/QacA subfamily drug resistance transporter